ncbi:hypothetical protein G418_06062 [Rhodococcus qingshengii BKS 20-40]|nr:hypothetical protein G418_06062 [Rhodococcus qingshengii BKS 20-40]
MVDGMPQVVLNSVDPDENFVEEPLVAGASTAATQPIRVGLSELVTPSPDRLVGDHDTTFEHEFLHVAEAQREPKIVNRKYSHTQWSMISLG